MITQSPRTEHIAAHITPEAKKEMYRLAAKYGKSMSLIISELISQYIATTRELERK